MNAARHFTHLTTEELILQFKTAALGGQPSKELIDELASRPGIGLINATDSQATTFEKVRAVIQKVEEANQTS